MTERSLLIEVHPKDCESTPGAGPSSCCHRNPVLVFPDSEPLSTFATQLRRGDAFGTQLVCKRSPESQPRLYPSICKRYQDSAIIFKSLAEFDSYTGWRVGLYPCSPGSHRNSISPRLVVACFPFTVSKGSSESECKGAAGEGTGSNQQDMTTPCLEVLICLIPPRQH